MENGHAISKLVTKLNPIDSKIIVIASFPERAFLLILQIATTISKIKYIPKLNERGTNTLNIDPIRGIITTKIKTSLYQVLLSNTLLGLECDYINLMLNTKTKGKPRRCEGSLDEQETNDSLHLSVFRNFLYSRWRLDFVLT